MHISTFFYLLMIGTLLGFSILLWINYRDQANCYQRLIGFTAFLTFDLILFGGFTRLTDSGLGCPDWPGCYTQVTPFHARESIQIAQALQPSGPVTMFKAWIEMLHRYFAIGVGFLITCIMIFTWRRQQKSLWLATALFFLVCLQGTLGALTVTMKLQPLIVTLHLLLGLTLFAGLLWLNYRQKPTTLIIRDKQVQFWALVALMTLIVQIALGGWVSANYAVLACSDFPLCHGQWFPEMDFAQGFTLWRALGQTSEGNMITMPALIAIHWLHRVFAIVVLLFMIKLIYLMSKYFALHQLIYTLIGSLLLQIITGISNIILQWPLLGAVLHNGGAALLLLLLVRINYYLSN